MMRQLCFFVGSTWMVVSQLALMYGSFPQLELTMKSDTDFEKSLVMLAVNGDEDGANNKIAPWLTPPKGDSSPPRAFILESSITDVAKDKYGVDLIGIGSDSEQNRVNALLTNEICRRELHLASTASACENKLEMTTCTTCSSTDGMWYSSVSQAGSAMAHTLPDSTVVVSTPTTTFQQLDIVVSSAPNEDYVNRLSKTLAQFRSQTFNGQTNADLILRLIILFDGKASPSQVKKELAQRIGLVDENNIVLVSSRGASEKLIISSLYEQVCSGEDCLVISIQDTTTISSSYLRNCMSFVQNFASVYFPVPHSKEGSVWYGDNYASFALTGSDTKVLGGAGQDDFFRRVQEHRHIVRMHEDGITYEAATVATVAAAVAAPVDQEAAAAAAVVQQEAAAVPQEKPAARQVEVKEYPTQQQQVVERKESESVPSGFTGNLRGGRGGGAGGAAPIETDAGEAPMKRGRRRRRNKKNAAAAAAASTTGEEALPPIFIAVTTSRKNFVKRVATIMKTWGGDLPDHVVIGFFIGQPPKDDYTAATADNLANLAGLEDAYSIIEVDVPDSEEVKKNAAVLKHTQKIVRASQHLGETNSIEWVFHVEDDAYVNIPQLTQLTKERLSTDQHFVGLPGNRTGVTQPFCMGGPGYLLSQATLASTAPHLDTCVSDVDANSEASFRKSVWHSDVLVGLCVFLQAGIGCSSDTGENSEFVHLHKETNPWSVLREKTEQEGPKFVSVHPLWAEGHMENVHRSVQIGLANKPNNMPEKHALSPSTSPLKPTTDGDDKPRRVPKRFQKQLENLVTPEGAQKFQTA